MARFDTSGLDDIIRGMDVLGDDLDAVTDEMLTAAADEVSQAWKGAADEAGHRDTGDMIRSIGYPRKPKVVSDIKRIDICPQGKDSKGVRNAEKAFVLHYGTSKMKGSRFVDVADRRSGPAVEKTMRDIYDRELKKKGFT